MCSVWIGRWRCAAASAEGPDLGQQFLGIHRLGHVIACALTHAPDPIGFLILAGAHDDGNAGVLGIACDRPRQLKPILTGHHHVHQNEFRLFLAQPTKGFFSVLGGAHVVAIFPQQVRQDHQFGLGIIHNEYFFNGHHAAPVRWLPNCCTACSSWSLVKGLVRYSCDPTMRPRALSNTPSLDDSITTGMPEKRALRLMMAQVW